MITYTSPPSKSFLKKPLWIPSLQTNEYWWISSTQEHMSYNLSKQLHGSGAKQCDSWILITLQKPSDQRISLTCKRKAGIGFGNPFSCAAPCWPESAASKTLKVEVHKYSSKMIWRRYLKAWLDPALRPQIMKIETELENYAMTAAYNAVVCTISSVQQVNSAKHLQKSNCSGDMMLTSRWASKSRSPLNSAGQTSHLLENRWISDK